jgi:hypothetical protein
MREAGYNVRRKQSGVMPIREEEAGGRVMNLVAAWFPGTGGRCGGESNKLDGGYGDGDGVTAPILRVPEEGTLGAEKHLKAHLDKLLEGGGVKVIPLVDFRLLSHPLSHLKV